MNIGISFYSSILEWYTFNNFEYNIFKNNLEVKSWVNTLLYRFKILISITLGLFTDGTYLFKDICYC